VGELIPSFTSFESVLGSETHPPNQSPDAKKLNQVHIVGLHLRPIMDPPSQRKKKADKAKEKKERNPYSSKHVRSRIQTRKDQGAR